jgi:hypothetical protein
LSGAGLQPRPHQELARAVQADRRSALNHKFLVFAL